MADICDARITRERLLELVVMALPAPHGDHHQEAFTAETRVRAIMESLNIGVEGEPPCADCGAEGHPAKSEECNVPF